MDAWRPAPDELPTEIAVFPLAGALLLPFGKLPLNIFEPRYKAMVEDCLAGQRLFGMIQPDGTAPPEEPHPALCEVGCLGRLSSFSETGDGRYLIALTGILRFEVRSELDMRRGYRRVATDYSRFLRDLDPPAEVGDRSGLMTALRAYFTANGFDANWSAIEAMEDNELLVTLCMVCPFEPPEKQALLEATSTQTRVRTLTTLLQMGVHGPGDGWGVS